MSVVLFPALKRMEPEKLPELYFTVRKYLAPGLCLAMFLYFLCKVLLENWLPLYKVSCEYLGLLLPSILFTTKTGLLTNNYLKHYRKEKELLKINVWTVVLSVFVSLFSALVLQSLTVLLIGIVFALGVRTVWSELVVMKEIGKIEWKGIVAEFLYSVIFILWVI